MITRPPGLLPHQAVPPPRPRFAVATKVAGCMLVVATGLCVLWSLALQFHFSPTDEAVYQTAVGAAMQSIVWVGAPLGLVAALSRRRGVGIACLVAGISVLSFAVARTTLDLDPEAGERRVASAFVPPPGAVATTGDAWRGYSFPDLSVAWEVPTSDESDVCEEARASMTAWSEREPRDADVERGCFITGVRDGHDGSVSVRTDFDDPTQTEVVLVVTRRV